MGSGSGKKNSVGRFSPTNHCDFRYLCLESYGCWREDKHQPFTCATSLNPDGTAAYTGICAHPDTRNLITQVDFDEGH